MDSISRACISFLIALALVLAAAVWSRAEPLYVLLYVDAVSKIDDLSAAQKAEVVGKYPPPAAVLNSAQWKNATAAQKWTYWKANVMPDSLKARIARQGKMPILKADQMELIDQYWLIAQEGTRSVFLLHTEYDGSFAQVRSWLDKNGYKYWAGRTMLDACRKLYQAGRDGDAVAAAVAKRVIRYPVDVIDSQTGKQVRRFVPIAEAESVYGAKIEPDELLKYKDQILPIRILDGSK